MIRYEKTDGYTRLSSQYFKWHIEEQKSPDVLFSESFADPAFPPH
jgi:hypothetical protein